jgi:ankyrin repeat protein
MSKTDHPAKESAATPAPAITIATGGAEVKRIGKSSKPIAAKESKSTTLSGSNAPSSPSAPPLSSLRDGTKTMTSDFIHWAKMQPIDVLTQRVVKDRFRLDKGVDGKGNTLLHAACEVGNISLVQTLLSLHSMKTVYSVTNQEGLKPFHVACQRGMIHLAMYLINEKHITNPAEKTADHRTALHLATSGNHLELISYLLRVIPKSELWVKDLRGFTPLHVACMEGHVEAMKLLAAAPGASLTLPDKQGKGCLDIACILGHVSLAKAILSLPPKLRPSLNAKSGPNSYSCLHWACANQQYSAIKFLVQDQDADCAVKDANGLTPDMLVSDPVVSLLLRCGNMRDEKEAEGEEGDEGEGDDDEEEEEDEEGEDEGEDEEEEKEEEGEEEEEEEEEEEGEGDEEEVEESEEEEGECESEEEDQEESEEGEDEEGEEEEGDDGFDDQVLFEWIFDESKLGDLEEQLGSAPNILRNVSSIFYSSNKETLLHLCCQRGAPMTMVQYLIEGVGIDLNQQDGNGLTALHCAITACNVPVVKYLIKYCGALLDLKDHQGQSVSDLCKTLMVTPPSALAMAADSPSPAEIASRYEEILKMILKGKKKTPEERTKITIPSVTLPPSSP